MTLQLLHFNFLIYEENFIFFFSSVKTAVTAGAIKIPLRPRFSLSHKQAAKSPIFKPVILSEAVF